MSVAVEKITEPLLLGEGPHWDELQQALYFVNILGHTIHKYVPETGAHTKTNVGGRVGFIVPVEGTSDQFVIGVERTFLVVRWDGVEGSPATVEKEIREIDAGTRNRLNDGKADPRGRLFAGTMGHEDPPGNYELNKGSLYRVEGTRVSQVADQVGISNGLAWDLKEKALYYIDSMERKVRRYDYNVDSALITKPTYVFDFDKNNLPDCFPDGCTIDTDGNLWVAVFDGSCVIKVDPRTGKLLQKLEIPAKQVTSVTFGGPNYDVLFVTSASMNIKGPQEPPCGCVFKVTGLGVRGLPNYSFKL